MSDYCSDFRLKAKQFFEESIKNNKALVTSVITNEEYMVQPFKRKRQDLIKNYEKFIEYAEIEVITIDPFIAKLAAQIRSQYEGFKAMDALQLASAIESKCDAFLTNDRQLIRYDGIKCILLADL